MCLSVDDPDAYRFAQAIAQETGQTMTQVVTEALRERYARIQNYGAKASVEELLGIAKQITAQTQGRHIDHAELLYDDYGLPK